ncbi:hypothetical protein HYX05_04050 [Candidatus Woesearchaeota archaeon]|nr:hypothetical protein [Candidatus Woesearchaeota archaeon]
MAFFRIKKIKGKEYAYVVENEWKRKGSRQKVKGYLGRAYRLDLKNNVDFLEFLKTENFQNYVESSEKNKIISDLIEWELYRFGADKNIFSINLNNKKIQKSNKDVVFLINDGFMCSFTLKNLLEFGIENDEQADGYRFARAFVEAGIKVPQEIFIGLFGKLYKNVE